MPVGSGLTPYLAGGAAACCVVRRLSLHRARLDLVEKRAMRSGGIAQQIAAMAGHLTLGEGERSTRAADRLKLVKLLVGEE